MAIIFSPFTEDVLEGPYQPILRGVFLMLQLGKGTSQLETEMDNAVSGVLASRKCIPTRASTKRSQKD